MSPRMRLLVAACLFIGWIGYLAYLVAITRHPVILSRPQFLVADVYVLAELDGSQDSPNRTIRVRKVYWPKEDADLEGKEITVDYLDKCGKDNGWIGTGNYIVPLTKKSADGYALTEIPLSPGFYPDIKTPNFLRIYPATEQAQEQLMRLIEEFHGSKR